MKTRLLLTAAFLATATLSFGQSRLTVKPFQPTALKSLNAPLVSAKSVKPAVRRTVANGVFYTPARGTLYAGYNEEGVSFYPTIMIAPSFVDTYFTNQSSDKAQSKWTFGDNDASSAMTADYDLDMGALNPQGTYYLPTLTIGDSTWTLGQDNSYYAQYRSYLRTDSIGDHTFYQSGTGGGYGFGVLSTGYLYGTGQYKTKSGDTYTSVGFTQFVDKPVSPYWVDNIHSLVFSPTAPVSGNAQLTLTVYPAQGDSVYDSQNPIAVLTCTAADCTNLNYSTDNGGVTYKYYMLEFTKKTTDPLSGAEMTEPFTINQDVALVVRGCSDEGVDVDFLGHEFGANDVNDLPTASVDFAEGVSLQYRGKMAVDMSFTGMFDYVEAMDTAYTSQGAAISGLNIIRVSADGKTYTTEASNTGADVQGAYVNTALPWLDADGNPNYTAETPDWITDVTGDDSHRTSDGENTGIEVVKVTCEALPAGTSGRAASLYLVGRGYKASIPVIVLQGDASVADAIKNVEVQKTVNGAAYNLAGQRVSKSAKGFVIINGKKYLRK